MWVLDYSIWNYSLLSSGIFLYCPFVSDYYYRLPTSLLLGYKPIKRKKSGNVWMLGISGLGCGEMAMNSGATEIWSESGLPSLWVLWLWVKSLNLSEPHISLQTQAYEWGPHGGGLELNEAQKRENRMLDIGIPSIGIFFLTSFPFLLSFSIIVFFSASGICSCGISSGFWCQLFYGPDWQKALIIVYPKCNTYYLWRATWKPVTHRKDSLMVEFLTLDSLVWWEALETTSLWIYTL